MERFMLHLANSSQTPCDAQRILVESRRLTDSIARTIRDVRVATSHIELDIDVAGAQVDMFTECLLPIGRLVRATHITESPATKSEGIRTGISHFNSERFWESHESLEGVWKECERESTERYTVQGIILAAAALVHHQKDENDIAISILARAAEKLKDSSDEYFGIDIATVRQKIDDMLESQNVATFTIPSRAHAEEHPNP